MVTAVAFRKAKLSMANKTFYDLDAAGTVMRIVAIASTYTPDQTDEFVSDLANACNGTTNPYGATGGWTEAYNDRPIITTKTLTETGSNVDLDGDDIVLTLDSTAHSNMRFIVAYIEDISDAASPLLCYWDLGADKDLKTDNITLNITGILRF